eukprot:2170723-Prorocentrum_lima.AAC.1
MYSNYGAPPPGGERGQMPSGSSMPSELNVGPPTRASSVPTPPHPAAANGFPYGAVSAGPP